MTRKPMRPRYRALRGNGGLLRRVRNLADDLDHVAVRVPDAALAVGAVALPQDLGDAFELLLAAQLACVWLELLQRPSDELRDRNAVAAARRGGGHRRLRAGAGGEPLFLGGPDPVGRRGLRG